MSRPSCIRYLSCIVVTMLSLFATNTYAENVFYILRIQSPERMSPVETSMASLKNHINLIHILVPQAYHIDENGIVSGVIDDEVLAAAKKYSIKLMPLVTNSQFNKDKTHEFLTNKHAMSEAIQSLVTLCKKNNYYGLQLDFEMVNIEDKEALTHFYSSVAKTLHSNGFKVSFALAPVVSLPPQPSVFLKRIYTNWEGAYDFKQLGDAADFLSLMAYNQHAGGTTPGTTASYTWTEKAIQNALKSIPANKISLGIPSYSTYWYTGTSPINPDKIKAQSMGIDYKKAISIIHAHHGKINWDNIAKINFSIYEYNWLNEYIYLEDKKSLKAKLALIKKYHLRGFSLFDLGSEDPSIWSVLNNKKF